MNRLSNTDFLEAINFIGGQEKKTHGAFTPMTELDQTLESTGLDSLGIMMFFILLDEFFGIPEEKIEEAIPEYAPTGTSVFEFVLENQTKGFTIDELRDTFTKYK
jgi:acyl carrier protein